MKTRPNLVQENNNENFDLKTNVKWKNSEQLKWITFAGKMDKFTNLLVLGVKSPKTENG